MNTRRFRLTKAAKIIIFVLVMALIGGGAFAAVNTGFVKTGRDKVSVSSVGDTTKPANNKVTNAINVDESGNVINTEKETNNTINLSLDEWIGWKEIIDANGGLSTAEGSIYDQKGIKVNISIINDATQSSNALISGKLDAAGYTINRTAFLSQKFDEAGVDVIMPYITNFSNGGDGIIAKSDIQSVNDLVDANIGVPQFSEAHSLVVWFVNQSDLSQDEKNGILENLIYFETPDEAAKAFFAGKIDVAATWEPYLTQTQNMSNAHVLFSTATSSSLIMDGILFNKEFAEAYPETVSAFIDGALEAAEMYETDLTTIKNVMPMFATASEQDIIDNCASARLTTYADNLDLFKDTARTIYTDMCDVWTSIGETVNYDLVDTIFDSTYITLLEDEYVDSEITSIEPNIVVSDENRQEIIDTAALLQKSVMVEFEINTAVFKDSADATQKLDDFISIAKILNGSIIQIEGNTEPRGRDPETDEEALALSENRADTIKQYFIMNGINPNRIFVVGNGATKTVKEAEEGITLEPKRTDISFKLVE